MSETDGRWRHASGDDEDGCIPCGDDDTMDTGGALAPYCKDPLPDTDEPGVCAFCSHTVERAA